MIKKYTIKGLVQGIGYRPFVARIAEELNIDGWVRNTGGIVTVLVSGDETSLRKFETTIEEQVPTGGFITSIQTEEISDFIEVEGFRILDSNQDTYKNLPLIPADIATCPECEKELLDPNNRRYKHPFISCTVCGPRYSILEKLPYDRDTITMSDFEMCPECAREYTEKSDRRRHAQTIACPDCGPVLSFLEINEDKKGDFAGNLANDSVHRKFTSYLSDKYILAIKDIGGYHLACSPFDEKVVADLRILKHRENKPFAVMFENVEQIRKYGIVNQQEQQLLESPASPILLIKRKQGTKIAENVCLTSPYIGAMLPSNPLQIMLIRECGPLIMTSGNASGDVLEIDNDNMYNWLKDRTTSGEITGTKLVMLSHNRRILRPMDDSVMKVVMGRTQFIRRGRGHVPTPIPVDINGEIFSAGGDLKSTFCYVKNGLAYVSQHLGDLESVACQKFYKQEKEAMARIFEFAPNQIAIDKHPGYFSANLARNNQNTYTEIQHHKAHVAAVIAEYHLQGPVLGFAFDGTGYGDDGTVWGSEVFKWDGTSILERTAHLKPVKLIGGDEGAKNCDTILTGMLYGKGINMQDTNPNANIIKAALDNNVNTITSTSMGRLFDAVSALLDICHYNTYEGQAPIELENVAATTEEYVELAIGKDGDTTQLFKDIVNTISTQIPTQSKAKLAARLARGFIYAVSDYIVTIAKDQNIKQIVLSGGTFLNRILLERTITNLESEGFEVFIAEQLPPGDGGICLGQAYLASRESLQQ